MGSRTLEATLRWRLLLLVGPPLLGVGLASFAITGRAFAIAEDDAARGRAVAALKHLRSELAEGDVPEDAVREVLLAADSDGVRLSLRLVSAGPQYEGRDPMPEALRSLSDGECGQADDVLQRGWRGCRVANADGAAAAAVSIDGHRALLRSLAVWMFGIVGFAVIATVAAARIAVRRPLRSLQRLSEWSAKIAAGDALPPPAPRTGATREIERLTEAFDGLVRQLLEALARARASSAHIAHELRTPLTSLRVELEAQQGAGDVAACRMLGDVSRLADVIDTILLLSAPPHAIKGRVVNVADIVRSLAISPTRVDAPDEALIDADPHLVELALRNLLDNATKYSGRPASELHVVRSDEGVRIAVLDDGPGLDEDARGKMFDRYWRYARDESGSGLGLALVRAVAERHGGYAAARPSPTSKGLEVSMTFPRLLGWHDSR